VIAERAWESAWWGTCANTYGEETKQLVYAAKMNLPVLDTGGPGPWINMEGLSIMDFGGGPCSLLLKVVNASIRAVVDPGSFPAWVADRYRHAAIKWIHEEAEHAHAAPPVDEIWIYNTLQHVRDPEAVVAAARRCGRFLRMVEWVDVPAHDGHPHELHRNDLERWIGAEGMVHELNAGGAVGHAFIYNGPLR
jgi:hypothetical protein